MKQNFAKAYVNNEGSLETRKATINLNPTIAHVLSRDLYQKPVESMFREILINAIDAHIEAGEERPVDVRLPSLWSEEFYIRDYGLGLEHSDLMNIYLDYGNSRRRDKEQVHGELGLGTKSPLSYTTAFSVESFYNGEHNSYLVYYDEDNLPCVDHRSSEPTNEPNGLKVSLTTLRSNDYNLFHSAAEAVLPRLPRDKYNVVNIADMSFSEEHLIPKKGKRLGNIIVRPGSGLVIQMGYIGYTVDQNVILNYLESKDDVTISIQGESRSAAKIMRTLLGSNAIEVSANIGDYQVHPSREHVNITPRTVKSLCSVVEEAINELFTDTEKIDLKNDVFRYNLTHYIDPLKSAKKLRARIFSKPSYSWGRNEISGLVGNYGGLVQSLSTEERDFDVAIMPGTDLTDYLGGTRYNVPLWPPSARKSAIIAVDESPSYTDDDVLKTLRNDYDQIDISVDIEEYRRVRAERSASYAPMPPKPRTVVRSMSDPKHNVLILKSGALGHHKVDWASSKHSVTTLKELGRKIFWTPTRMGCLADKIGTLSIMNRLKDLSPMIPKWKKPIILGLPASKGTKTLEAAFESLVELDKWLDEFVKSDYYIRRANIKLAGDFASQLIYGDLTGYGPASWLNRLEQIAAKLPLTPLKDVSSAVYIKADRYIKDVRIKFPKSYAWAVSEDGAKQWAEEVAELLNLKPTGAKAKNDPYYLQK